MLDVHRLVTLREFAIRGSIAEAAAALRLTPSAVSQQLAALDRQAGTPLLRKSGRRLVLTPAGQTLVAAGADVLDAMERAETALAARSLSVHGRVRLAAFQSAALALVPQALASLARDYPEVRVELVQYEPGLALYETWARDFDLVVAEEYPGHSRRLLDGLVRVPLTCDQIYLAVPTDQAGINIGGLLETANLPWAMEPEGTAARQFAVQTCRQAGFEPDVRYVAPDLLTHFRLVEAGQAATFMPSLALGAMSMSSPQVALLEIPGRPRRTIFTAYRAAAAASPALAAVRAALQPGQSASSLVVESSTKQTLPTATFKS